MDINHKKAKKRRLILNILIYAIGPAMFLSGFFYNIGFRVRNLGQFMIFGTLIIGVSFSLKQFWEEEK